MIRPVTAIVCGISLIIFGFLLGMVGQFLAASAAVTLGLGLGIYGECKL